MFEEKIKVAGLIWPMEEQVSTDQTATDQTTTQDNTSDQTATTQDATSDQTATDQASLGGGEVGTEPQVTWTSLGSKTYTVNAELPTCGIKVTNVGFHLYKNGTEIQDGATVYTSDTISAKMTFTVAPASSGCAGYGTVKLEVYLDGNLKSAPTKNYTELTSSRSDSISYTIGTLSAGSHTITLKGYYASNPPV